MSDGDYTIKKAEVELPPSPPNVQRKHRTTPAKGLILSLITLVVVLALVGLFGERREVARQQTASLDIEIEYPTRFRYKQVNPIRIVVRNLTGDTIDTLIVALDPAYIEEFSNVSATPSFARAWEVELYDMKPGEARRVVIGLQGEQYGLHEGIVSAFAPGLDTVQTAVKTFILP